MKCRSGWRIYGLMAALAMFIGTGPAQARGNAVILFLYDISDSYSPGSRQRDAAFDQSIEDVLRNVDDVQTVEFALLGNCECACHCRDGSAGPGKLPCTPPHFAGGDTAPEDRNNSEDAILMRKAYYKGILRKLAEWQASHPLVSKATDIAGALCKASDLFRRTYYPHRYVVLLSDLQNKPADRCAKIAYDREALRDVKVFAYRDYDHDGKLLGVGWSDILKVNVMLGRFGAPPIRMVGSGSEIAAAINYDEQFP